MRQGDQLTKPAQYALVYRQGRSWSSGPLVMRATPNGLPASRYGFSVSRRLGSAVTRNRVKRWLREIMRGESLRPGHDIVFVARVSAPGAGYAGLKAAAQALLARARLLAGPEDAPTAGVGTGTVADTGKLE